MICFILDYVEYVNVCEEMYMIMFVFGDTCTIVVMLMKWEWCNILVILFGDDVMWIICTWLGVSLMMMTCLSILLKWWLCLFEIIRWEYMWILYVVMNMRNWRCKRWWYVTWWEEMWYCIYVVKCLIEVVMFEEEFC